MSDNEAFNKCTTDAASRSGDRFATSFYTMQTMYVQAQARVYELEAALREIYEVYAGSEGIPQPISASEGYLLQLIKDMVAISRAALAGEKNDD
jgi:hypothetical protein